MSDPNILVPYGNTVPNDALVEIFLPETGHIYSVTVEELINVTSNNGPYGSNGTIAFNNDGIEAGDANLVWNSTSITLMISNATVNSTVYSGMSLTANDSNNLGGILASEYQTISGLAANVATLTSNNTLFVGTVSAINVVSNAQLSSNLSAYQTTVSLAANVMMLTSNDTLFVGTVSAANVVSNAQLQSNLVGFVSNIQLSANLSAYQTTTGLASNVAILTANDTLFVGTVSAVNVVSNAQLSGNLSAYVLTSNLLSASYANTTNTSATNITMGTLPWSQAPVGTVNTSGDFIITGVQSYIANISVNGSIIANGSVGTSGQTLTSAGNGNVYWSTITSGNSSGGGPYGANTQIAFNNSGIESGDTNLTWNTVNALFTIGNSTINAQMNSSSLSIGNGAGILLLGANVSIQNDTLYIGNSTVNSTVNSTSLSLKGKLFANNANNGTVGQVLTSGGSGSNVYWSTVTGGSGGGPYGANTQIAFNNSGTESGDANLTWFTTTGTLNVGNSISNVSINSTSIKLANAGSGYITVGSNVSIQNDTLSIGSTTINSSAITFKGSIVASNGYTWLPNSLMMNWGTVAVNSSVGTITFANVFPTACFNVSATSNSVGATNVIGVTGITTTGCTLRSTSTVAASNVYFMAIGH